MVRFTLNHRSIEEPKRYFPVIYEFQRNLRLIGSLTQVLIRELLSNRHISPVRIFAVSSPLTVPLIALIIKQFIPLKLLVVEFQDLEPELAIELKNLNQSSLIYRLELWLEKIIVQNYRHVIVTSESQKQVIIDRAQISKNKIHTILNLPVISGKYLTSSTQKKWNNNIENNRYLNIGYISTSYFGYYVSGFPKMFNAIRHLSKKSKNIKFNIIGDGDGIQSLKTVVRTYKFDRQFVWVGRVDDIRDYYRRLDVTIIPWTENEITKSILPTRFFESLSYGVPVIVPSFSPAASYVKHGNNSFVFNDWDDLANLLNRLSSNKTSLKNISLAALSLYKDIKNTNRSELVIKQIFRVL